MSDAAKKLPAPATHPLADSLIGEWQREFPDLDEKTLAQFVGENGSTLRTHLQAEWSKELHIAGLGAVVGDTPSQTELFFVTVFGEGATDGDVCVMRADSNTITDRDLDTIGEFVSAGPDGEAWVSMQTRSEDTKLWEQAAIAAHPKDINRFKDMPPASVKLRHAEGDVYLIWLLKDTVDLRKGELAKQLTDAAPLPGFGGWSIEAVDTDLTYELKDLQSIMVPPAPAAGEVVPYGKVDPELLAREMTLALSPQGQQTKPGNWRNKPFTVQQLIDILSLHKIGEKDGACILQGPVIDGKRMANAVPHLDLLIIDLDTGQSIDEMRAKLQEKGLFAIIYTTHSHGKEGSEIKRDELIKHLDGNTKFDLSDICNYLITKKRYQPELLEGAELVDSGAHTGEGIKVRIRHKPMPKFRVVLVLKEPFVIKDRADTQQEAIKIWKELYAGASQMLGAYFDRSCVDPSRLFFTPRHPKTAKEWRVEIIAGNTLDIDTCERISAEDQRREGLSPIERAAEEMQGKSGGKAYKTEGILPFFARYGDRFDVETFLLDMDGDGDRGARSNGPGRTHRCPNDDAHSDAGNENDRAFFCVNGTDSDKGGAVARCMHDTCSTLDRIDFVDIICDRVGITNAEDLKKWVPKTKEDEAEEAAEAASPEASTDTAKVEWPPGYKNHHGSFGFMAKSEGDEKASFNRISNALAVLGLVKDERGKGWSLLLGFKDRGGKLAEVALSYADQLADQRSALRALGEAGLPMINKRQNKEKLFEALSQVKTDKVVTIASQPGRHGDAWLTPIGGVVNGDASTLQLTTEEGFCVDDRSTRGDLDGWKANVKEAFDILGFHSPVLVAATFAGALVTMLRIDGAALIFTGGSGTGKSLSQKLGAAAVGSPENKACCWGAGSMKILGLETHSRHVNGSCLHLDDLFVNVTDPELLKNMIFTMQAGVSASRGTPGGGSQKKRRWRVFYTVSAEQKLKDVIDQGMRRAYLTGVDVRALPISLAGVEQHTDPVMQERVKKLERALERHYGHAFPDFVRYAMAQGWMQNADPLHDRVQAAANWLLQWGARDGTRARAAYVLALALVAAELCQEAELFPTESMGADDGYIRQAFRRAWLASLGNPDEVIGNTPEAGLQRLQQQAVVQWGAHAKDAGDMALPDQPGQSRADTWFVYGPDLKLRGHHYKAVSQEAFRALVRPSDPDAVLKLMNERKMLIRTTTGKNVWPDMGKTVFAHYKVMADHLGPSLDSLSHDDAEAAPVDDTDMVETPRQRAERIRSELVGLRVAVPDLPADTSGDATWTGYGDMLRGMQADAERRMTSG